MSRLTHLVTGHRMISTDDASVEFWEAAGYRAEKAAPAKAPKKTASKKSSK